jgi:hypothetical protein
MVYVSPLANGPIQSPRMGITSQLMLNPSGQMALNTSHSPRSSPRNSMASPIRMPQRSLSPTPHQHMANHAHASPSSSIQQRSTAAALPLNLNSSPRAGVPTLDMSKLNHTSPSPRPMSPGCLPLHLLSPLVSPMKSSGSPHQIVSVLKPTTPTTPGGSSVLNALSPQPSAATQTVPQQGEAPKSNNLTPRSSTKSSHGSVQNHNGSSNHATAATTPRGSSAQQPTSTTPRAHLTSALRTAAPHTDNSAFATQTKASNMHMLSSPSTHMLPPSIFSTTASQRRNVLAVDPATAAATAAASQGNMVNHMQMDPARMPQMNMYNHMNMNMNMGGMNISGRGQSPGIQANHMGGMGYVQSPAEAMYSPRQPGSGPSTPRGSVRSAGNTGANNNNNMAGANMYGSPAGYMQQGVSNGNMYGQMTPGQMMPGQMTPGQMTPGQMTPGQMMPGQMMPGQMMPGQMMPGQMMPGQMTPGQNMTGQSSPNQTVPGQVTPGQTSPNQSIPGQNMPGQNMPGQNMPGAPNGMNMQMMNQMMAGQNMMQNGQNNGMNMMQIAGQNAQMFAGASANYNHAYMQHMQQQQQQQQQQHMANGNMMQPNMYAYNNSYMGGGMASPYQHQQDVQGGNAQAYGDGMRSPRQQYAYMPQMR